MEKLSRAAPVPIGLTFLEGEQESHETDQGWMRKGHLEQG